MGRIAQIDNISIDLENIKEVIFKKEYTDIEFSLVTIKLLRGKEFVFNPKEKEWEMFEAQIVVEFHRVKPAKDFQLEVEAKWQEYLLENDVKNKTEKN